MYFRPETLDEAVHVLAHSGGQILAGGTDFFPALGDRPVTGSVVDISGVRELRGVVTEPKYVKIGGLTTWTEVINAPLPRCFDGLKAAAREIGSIQIQNRATVAGNLCNASPAADSVPPLLTLDAEVELASQAGTRRLPLGDFIVGNRKTLRQPGEILSQILVPRTVENAASIFLKLGARRYLVISIAMVAAIIQKDSRNRVTDARVSVGSCSVVARRLPNTGADADWRTSRSGLRITCHDGSPPRFVTHRRRSRDRCLPARRSFAVGPARLGCVRPELMNGNHRAHIGNQVPAEVRGE